MLDSVQASSLISASHHPDATLALVLLPSLPRQQGPAGRPLPSTDPIMVVTLGDVVHKIRVRPGEEGQRAFQAEIRRLFSIPPGVEFGERAEPNDSRVSLGASMWAVIGVATGMKCEYGCMQSGTAQNQCFPLPVLQRKA
jgi:hypothetical protein